MDKNTILAFILIAVIIIIYPYFMPKQEVIKKSNPANPATVVEEKKAEAKQVEDSLLSDNKTEFVPATEQNSVYAPEEKDIKIETDIYRAVISTRDGIIKSWKVKQYKSRIDTSKIVELIKENTKNLESEIRLMNGMVIKNVVFEADTDYIKISGNGKTAELVLSYKGADGQVQFTKNYRFYSDKYSFDLSIDTTPIFSDLSTESAVGINWRDGIKFSEVSDNGKNLNREDYYRATYVKSSDKLTEYDNNDDPEKTTGEINWGATRSKYFEVFLASTTEKLSSFENSPAHGKTEDHYTSMGFSVNFNKNTDPVKNLLVYFGPMDYETFKTYDKEFGLTMNWGWDIIKPFSLGIYWTLKYLHKFIDNYGLVIIILSLLVNTLVLPFTLKSYKSQAEMKKIQPEIKVL
ncbi:MAG: membrane protein insertase YidC, partial [Candidatus Delongbacteria bacterium]|nr:membrane protein insertase YidC [Candidatus Delongbacteria bacterium]